MQVKINDIKAGVVVFLVAVPLCLGIALASGAPLFAGLIAGIVGGTVVSLLSGSALGVSGPAAGLAVIVMSSIATLGSYPAFLTAVVLAGVIQLVLGFLKAGAISNFFPSSVIKGMLSGIGVLIILKQIPHALGYDADAEGDWEFLQLNGENTFSAITSALKYFTPGAVAIAIVSMTILILWERPFFKSNKMFQFLPGPLVAVIAAILLNTVILPASLSLGGVHLVSVPVASSFSELTSFLTFPDFSQLFNVNVITIAFTLAIVASLETLLCLDATDKLDPQKRVSPANQELKAQGAGNIISGLIGGLPITQVIVRSSANIQAGGSTKLSAFFHGVLMMICVVCVPGLLNMIPLAVLASILLVTGYKLAKPALFVEMYKLGHRQLVPFVVTIVAIILTDLLKGICAGMVVSVLYVLADVFKKQAQVQVVKENDEHNIHITLPEDANFLHKTPVLRTLQSVPDGSNVIIRAMGSTVDHDIRELVNDFGHRAFKRKINIQMVQSPNN